MNLDLFCLVIFHGRVNFCDSISSITKFTSGFLNFPSLVSSAMLITIRFNLPESKVLQSNHTQNGFKLGLCVSKSIHFSHGERFTQIVENPSIHGILQSANWAWKVLKFGNELQEVREGE